MLEIKIKGAEFWNDETEEFVTVEPCTLMLEHSLISLSKWESKWKKPFLKEDPKTVEETRDYVRCMTINKNVSEGTYLALTTDDLKKINDYVSTNDIVFTVFSNSEIKDFQRLLDSLTISSTTHFSCV